MTTRDTYATVADGDQLNDGYFNDTAFKFHYIGSISDTSTYTVPANTFARCMFIFLQSGGHDCTLKYNTSGGATILSAVGTGQGRTVYSTSDWTHYESPSNMTVITTNLNADTVIYAAGAATNIIIFGA